MTRLVARQCRIFVHTHRTISKDPVLTRVLITAFEPFGTWDSNSSWPALVELTRNLPESPTVVTRLYPVEFEAIRKKLEEDLTADYDLVILLGQSQHACGLEFERVAVNVGIEPSSPTRPFAVEDQGSAAYQSQLPLETWVSEICSQGIPATVSHHAGEYCCNAAFYWCEHISRQRSLKTKSTFVHIPVTPRQAAQQAQKIPSMDSIAVATALRHVLDRAAAVGLK